MANRNWPDIPGGGHEDANDGGPVVGYQSDTVRKRPRKPRRWAAFVGVHMKFKPDHSGERFSPSAGEQGR